jgi:hypothetical protein
MRALESIGRIRTFRHIRTLRSVCANTGTGRLQGWPRVRDVESIRLEEARLLKARRRSRSTQRGAAPACPETNEPNEPEGA